MTPETRGDSPAAKSLGDWEGPFSFPECFEDDYFRQWVRQLDRASQERVIGQLVILGVEYYEDSRIPRHVLDEELVKPLDVERARLSRSLEHLLTNSPEKRPPVV